MLKKLCLDQTKIYEKHLALEEISIMLVSFVKGIPHNLAIGAEQGNIDKWDDLVIQRKDGGNIYIQAKRQTTDFSLDPIERDSYKKGRRKDTLRDLSPIDEALKSLGKRIELNDLDGEFRFVLPESSICIKDGLEIRHLKSLCDNHIKSVTMPCNLADLASIDNDVHNIYLWLTTWCGFKDWEHILKALKLLKIRTSMLEAEINERVKSVLCEIFKTTEIEQVRMLILSYLDENSTYAGAIKPRQLIHLLKEYLLPGIPRWTQFQTDGQYWNISGIHDLEDNNEIERPTVLVSSLWAKDNPNTRYLKIDGSCVENCLVSSSLIRLSIHPRGSFDIHCSNKNSWQNAIKIRTGGTIGVGKDDLDDLRLLDGLESYLMSDPKVLSTIDAKENYAEKLHNEMYKTTFKFLNLVIMSKIQEMKKSDLRKDVEDRWVYWKQLLENNIDEQKKLFSRILHPKAEGESISGELRVGPKTATLLCEAIFHLLIVSVCLGDESNKSWDSVRNKMKMNSIGLAYWSGPASASGKIIEIDADEGIVKLLENEPGDILIIPQSSLSEGEVFQDDIAGGIRKSELLTHPKYPKILITNDREYRKKIESGDIHKLQEYYQRSLDEYRTIIEDAVNKVVDKVIV